MSSAVVRGKIRGVETEKGGRRLQHLFVGEAEDGNMSVAHPDAK